MVLRGEDAEPVVGDGIDDTVGRIDTPRPCAGQAPFEGFGLADALERGTLHIPDERVDAFEGPAVLGLFWLFYHNPRKTDNTFLHPKSLPPPMGGKRSFGWNYSTAFLRSSVRSVRSQGRFSSGRPK